MNTALLFNIEAEEVAGELVSGKATFRVNIPYSSLSPGGFMATALSATGVPRIGDSFSPLHPWLAAAKRHVRIIKPRGSDDTIMVEIDIEYELWRIRDGVPESGSTTLEQGEFDRDIYGTPITVKYGDTIKPTTVDAPIYKSSWHEQVVYPFPDPRVAAEILANSVNLYTWRGKPPGTVLCTHVEWEPKDRSKIPPWWMFDADFETKDEKWLYKAAFKESDGTYPSPNSPATIYVKRHRSYDFAIVFG